MEVQIPSPSVFLRKSPVINTATVVPPKKTAIAKAKANLPAKPASKPVQDGAVTKPKQSKSRNGEYTRGRGAWTTVIVVAWWHGGRTTQAKNYD
jgi:hypothetical protein